MAVSWVAGTAPVHDTNTTLAANAPAGLADFDTLLAAVFAVSAITAPAGWTQRAATSVFTDGYAINGRLELWQKNSVASSDSSASFTWTQDDFEMISVAYGAARGVAAVDATSTSTESSSSDWSITIPTLAGTDADQMLLAIAANSDLDNVGADTRAPIPPSGTALGTGSSAAEYRVAIAYRTAGASDSISGAFAMHDTGSPPTAVGLGAISVRLSATGATPSAIIAADSPLGESYVLGYQMAGKIAVDSPLGAATARAWHDFSDTVDPTTQTLYVMDLITPDGDVRVPIGSWQGTLQLDAAQYLQCVVPNPGDLVDTITDATEFRISRRLRLISGTDIDFLVAQAPVDTVQYARGSTNYSAVISGYFDAAEEADWPADTVRTLAGIRAIFSTATSTRVTCSIDWLLSPGQGAIADGAPLTVSYINYTVSDGVSQMDVGERSEAP